MKFHGTNYAKIIDVRDKKMSLQKAFNFKERVALLYHPPPMSFKNKILCACYDEAGRSIPATDSQQLIYKQGNQIVVDYNFNFENNNKKVFIFPFLYQYGYCCQTRPCPHRLKKMNKVSFICRWHCTIFLTNSSITSLMICWAYK